MSEHQGKRYDNIALEFSKMRTSFYKKKNILIFLLKKLIEQLKYISPVAINMLKST